MWEVVKGLFSGGKIFQGAKDLIDEIVTSKEEKAVLALRFNELLNKHKETIMAAEVEDRKSARTREVEVVKAGSTNITQHALAYIGVIGFFAIVGYLLCKGLGHMTTDESFIIGNLTGMAGAISKDIFGYYFGSSKGERENQTWLKTKEKHK